MKKTSVPKLNPDHYYAESNDFITSVYDKRLTALGQKIIRLAIAEADSVKDEEFFSYKIGILELAKLLQIPEKDKRNLYRDVKKATRYMATMAVGIEKGVTQKNKTPSYRWLPVFQELNYRDNEGILEIQFNAKMTPFFLQLKKNFTKIPLWKVLEMDHKYSIRIFELIQMKLFNAKTIVVGEKKSNVSGKVFDIDYKEIEITVEEIRKTIGEDGEKKYKQISQLKDYVIKPSLNDIENKAGKKIEISDKKEGRKITAFSLNVWDKTAWDIYQLQKDQLEGQINIFTWEKMNETAENG